MGKLFIKTLLKGATFLVAVFLGVALALLPLLVTSVGFGKIGLILLGVFIFVIVSFFTGRELEEGGEHHGK